MTSHRATYRILVVAPSWLGDAVMSLPLIADLAAVDELSVCVQASSYTAPVYWGVPRVDEVLVLPKRGWTRSLVGRVATIRRLGFNGAVVLPPSFSSALPIFLAGIGNRVGFATDGRGWLLSERVSTEGLREEHLSTNYRRLGEALLRRMGLASTRCAEMPTPFVAGADRIRLRQCGVPDDGYCVVVPGATYGETKAWPRESYRALVVEVSRRLPVFVAGGERERVLCHYITENVEGAISLAGRTTMGELFALVAGARVVVANDSGVPHVAAALKRPTVVIFGSTSPTWTRPLGDTVQVVREAVACSPCFLKKCPTHLECYEGITPEKVLDAVLCAIDEVKPSAMQSEG